MRRTMWQIQRGLYMDFVHGADVMLTEPPGAYFGWNELTRSNTATRYGINNAPSRQQRICLRALVQEVLDPVRDRIGVPITVTSGYRCAELNRRVGGVSNSKHCRGLAADIVTKDVKLEDVMRTLKWAAKMTEAFDKAIYEQRPSGHPWIHVQIFDPTVELDEHNRRRRPPRFLNARIVDGKWRYETWSQ